MSSDDPASGGWTSPGQPPVDPAAPPGWGSPPYGWYPNAIPQAPRPGVIPLRPLAVGELLDGAFTTIRRYPAATLGLAAAVMLVVEVVQLVSSYSLLHGVSHDTATSFGSTTNHDFLVRSFALDAIVLVVTLVATVLLTGMLTAVVGQGVLGRPMSIADTWARTRPLLWRLVATTILVGLCWVAGGIVGALPGIVITVVGIAASSDGVIALGLVLAFIGGAVTAAYVYVKLLLSTPALVLEKLRVTESLSRSWGLVKSSWWRVLGIALLAQIIAGIIGGIIQAPFAILGGIGTVFSGHPEDQFTFTSLLLSGIGGLLSATLVRPFSAGVIALLYIDRRMRAEALDLTLQQAAAGSPP